MSNTPTDPNPHTLRPTVMDVNLSSLGSNLGAIRQKVAPSKVMAVVKANAYGHGLIPCARHLESLGVDYFGVALVEEGIELRRSGIATPILVFGGLLDAQIQEFLRNDLDITASSVSKLDAIDAAAKSFGKRARVHLKIDTGMGRIGVQYYSAEKLIAAAARCRNIEVVGIYSHFASAESDENFTREQLARFLGVLDLLPKYSLPTPIRHIANSGGILSVPESTLDMVRVGLLLYGIYPEGRRSNLIQADPVMSLRSQVVYFKVLPKGAGVSYGHLWRASKETRIVTVPIGYGDGYSRRLSNRGSVLIRGKRYPIVGAICMDQLMVDIGWDEAFNGEEVVLIGQGGEEAVTVAELAKHLETCEHEVLTSINIRVPRRYHL